jgi:hypothetical protein
MGYVRSNISIHVAGNFSVLLCFHDALDALLLNSLLEIDPNWEAKEKRSRNICDLSWRWVYQRGKFYPQLVLTVTNDPLT